MSVTTNTIQTAPTDIKGRSLWQDAWRRFRRNKAAIASIIILALIAIFVTIAPMLMPFGYADTDWANMQSAPSMATGHYFGTDTLGRDLLVRVAIGGRISLMVGIAGAFVAVLIGTVYGAISGYAGGKVDMLMMRFLEVLSAFPFMFFVILLVTLFGRNIFLIFVAIGLVSWLDVARMVRGQTLSLKNKEFIEAAQVGGQRRGEQDDAEQHDGVDDAGNRRPSAGLDVGRRPGDGAGGSETAEQRGGDIG